MFDKQFLNIVIRFSLLVKRVLVKRSMNNQLKAGIWMKKTKNQQPIIQVPILNLTQIEQLTSVQNKSTNMFISNDMVKGISLAHMDLFLASPCTKIIHIEDTEQLDAILSRITAKQKAKLTIVSANTQVLQAVFNSYSSCRRVFYAKEHSWSATALICLLNKLGIKTVLLQPELALMLTHTLHKHALVVWSHGEEKEKMHKLFSANVDAMTLSLTNDSRKMFDEYLKLHILKRPVFVAHRGAPQLDIENTLPAFEKAVEYGADVLETDIRETKDKQLILFHDPDIKRITSSKGLVSSFLLEELKDLLPVVTLDTFLTRFRQSPQLLLIEIKERHTVTEVIKLVEKYSMEHRVHIQSFDPESLQTVRSLNEEIGVSLLYSHNKWSKNRISHATVHQTLSQTQSSLNIKSTRSFHRTKNSFSKWGLHSFIWTIRREKELYRLWSLGVSGLIIDCIQHLIKIPTHLEILDAPKFNQNGDLVVPEKAYACYTNGSKKLVPVKWMMQEDTRLIELTSTTKRLNSLNTFCIYQFSINGLKRSVISKMTIIEEKK